MARNLTAAMISALTAATVSPRLLAFFDFPSGAVRVWTGQGDQSWDSQTWNGIGSFGTFRPPQTGSDISAKGAEFGLTGIPSSTLSAALGDAYQGKICKCWLACLDSAGAIVADPYLISYGFMDTMTIDEGGATASVKITSESRLKDLERPRVRRYTDEDQQHEYPGDLGLEFVAAIQNLPIHWGQKNQERTIPRRLPNPKTNVG